MVVRSMQRFVRFGGKLSGSNGRFTGRIGLLSSARQTRQGALGAQRVEDVLICERQTVRQMHITIPTACVERPSAEDWPEHEFHEQAEATLTSLHDTIEGQAYDKVDGFDIELTMGVLTVELGDDIGTYVLNTQTPNRQLWLSSPKSGPARYYWDFKEQQWRSSRDGHYLRQKLGEELSKSCGVSIPPSEK